MKAEKCPVCDRETKDGGIKVTVGGKGVACHTGARSCFYRALALGCEPPDIPLQRV